MTQDDLAEVAVAAAKRAVIYLPWDPAWDKVSLEETDPIMRALAEVIRENLPRTIAESVRDRPASNRLYPVPGRAIEESP